MTERVPLFVELCCGSAAVTLRLIGGPNARPPISYMGSKRGYAEAILNVLGLRSGQGADAVVLVEAGPWARAWRLLTTPEGCRAVADVIRGWVGEDARALWDRLRAEPVPEDAAEAVGAWLIVNGQSVQKGGEGGASWFTRPNGEGQRSVGSFVSDCAALSALSWPPVRVVEGDVCGVEPREVAKWLWVAGHGDFSKPPRLAAQYDPEKAGLGWGPAPKDWLAKRVERALSWPPVRVVEGDVCGVEPREVAKWLWLQARTCNSVPVFVEDGKWCMCEKRTSARRHIAQTHEPSGVSGAKPIVQRNSGAPGNWGMQNPETLAARSEVCHQVLARQPVVLSTADVASVKPGELPAETVVYMDPPYQGCTGYGADLPREQVLSVARLWAEAGATVCVSEAEPLADLVAEGWHAVEITGCRVGQKRTFSKQKREWLTLNREPAWHPGVQGELL